MWSLGKGVPIMMGEGSSRRAWIGQLGWVYQSCVGDGFHGARASGDGDAVLGAARQMGSATWWSVFLEVWLDCRSKQWRLGLWRFQERSAVFTVIQEFAVFTVIPGEVYGDSRRGLRC